MKFRNIITVALASSLVFAACTKEDATDSFENIKLDKTYLSIDPNGGSASVKISATEAWHLNAPDATGWAKSTTWVTPSDTVGVAGDAEITFTAEANVGREVNLTITCGSNTQNLVIRQGDLTPTEATCAEIISGSIPQGKTVIVTGTCTNIYNTTYGNWYLNDGTGEITIYGTLYKGKTKQFASLGIEAGDVVTVQGPYTLYGTTHELTDVTVLNITKALAKVESESRDDVAQEGETFDVKVSFKGKTLDPAIPEAYQDWISILGVTTKSGTPTKIETNPADTAFVKVKVAPNEGGDREGQVNFTSSTTEVSYTFTQKGAIIETTIDNILAAADGNTQYRTTGYITKDKGNDYGNIYIKDATGEIYVYGVLDSKGQSKQWKTMGISEGDIVTVVGPKASYNGTAQLKNVSIEKHYAVKDISLADFRNLSNDKTTYYRISGTVAKSTEENTKFDLETYGNFALTDGTTEVYVYGVRTGWGGAKGQFGTLGVKEGDKLTIVCYKTSHNDLIEADGCFYVSHEAGSVTPDPTPDTNPYSIDLNYTLGANAYDDGVATINGVEGQKVLKIGTSSKVGSITVTVPAGTKKVSFYAVAWKGNATTLTFSLATTAGTISMEQDIAANDGATSNSPYTITVADSDKYTFEIPVELTADTPVTISTKTGAKPRAIFFGLKKN